MRNILVTGGFGFIGSHLVEELIGDPHNRVHVVDNFSTSPIDLEAYLAHLGRPQNLTYDICSVEQFCKGLADNEGFDQIYHLASVVGPVGVLSYAGQLAFQIISDTDRLINLALRTRARIVDISTSEVYGGGRDGYCSEKDFKIIQPKVTVRLEYAIGKLAAEVALINASRVMPLEVAIVRPFNVAGPRQTGAAGFVIPRFISQAIVSKPLTVYNDGKMIRAFTHVKDIVRGIMLVMEKGENGEPYNIGNPANKISILELAGRVIRLARSNSEIVHVDPKELFGPLFEEANDKYPDADRAMSRLGWRPIHSIDDIILDSLEYITSGRRN
jgi:nucleoside-diphosphate-sugar epimerase